VDIVHNKLSENLTIHSIETDKSFVKLTQDVNAKTTVVAADLNHHIEQTATDMQTIRQELNLVRERVNKDVSKEMESISVKVADCNNKIETEKQSHHSEIVKLNQEIDKVKERLSVRASNGGIVGSTNQCQIINVDNGRQGLQLVVTMRVKGMAGMSRVIVLTPLIVVECMSMIIVVCVLLIIM
jgi:small-conductance mechanosensitive channel